MNITSIYYKIFTMAVLSEREYDIAPAKLGKLIDPQGSDINFQISSNGGLLDLGVGKSDENGFYIAVAGDAGVLSVKLMNSDNYVSLPFFSGWNPVLVKEVANSGATATSVYWGQ